jgi:mRNA-degrading endonuclease RelE of RelBE toxin-antitoxin system
VRIRWEEPAKLAVREKFMKDQAAMAAINAAVDSLAEDPGPAAAFVRGGYRRLRAGDFRILYEIEDGTIVIVRVDRRA